MTDDDIPERPRTRGECGSQRPCLFFTCRYNLSTPTSDSDLDENGIPLNIEVLSVIDTASMKVRRLPILVEQSRSNCVLDYGGDVRTTVDTLQSPQSLANMTIEEIASILGIYESEVIDALTSGLSKLKHYSQGSELLAIWKAFQRIGS